MAKAKKLNYGDRCPIDGGPFIVDAAQLPQTVIDRRKRNTDNPAVVARFADIITEKAEEHGLIYKCVGCGYRARLKPGDDAPLETVDHAPARGELASPSAPAPSAARPRELSEQPRGVTPPPAATATPAPAAPPAAAPLDSWGSNPRQG